MSKRKSMSGKNSPISKKLARGTLYQTKPGGTFYFRYQINGMRKTQSMQTKDISVAEKKVAENILPLISTTSVEVIAAHVKQAKSLETHSGKQLVLSKAWETYSEHPDRAIPATKNEVLAYQASFKDFAKRILAQNPNIQLHEITPKHAQEFADHLKTTEIAVDTHNRKIKHVRKVFNVLHIYCQGKPNPFLSKNLFRSNKEERNFAVRRLPFSHEQEKELLAVLDNPKKKVINKDELKIIFYLGMFTGQRLKDCVLLRWNRINFQRRIIEVKQYKTGKEVIIHMAEHLYQVLQEALKWKKEDHDFVCPKVAMRYNQVDENGKNTGSGLVNIDVMRIIRAAGIEPSVAVEGRKKAVTVYGFHSLRHSFVSRCALEGVPKAVVLSIVGADSEVVDKYYTHVGEKAQQQAIEAIAGNVGMLSAEDKINRTLTYIDNLKKSDELQEIIKLLTEN